MLILSIPIEPIASSSVVAVTHCIVQVDHDRRSYYYKLIKYLRTDYLHILYEKEFKSTLHHDIISERKINYTVFLNRLGHLPIRHFVFIRK